MVKILIQAVIYSALYRQLVDVIDIQSRLQKVVQRTKTNHRHAPMLLMDIAASLRIPMN